MPQKRNPDAAELVRAKTGRIIGALTALMIVMKGLPLAYQKDMQVRQGGRHGRAVGLVALYRCDGRHGARHEARYGTDEAAAGQGYSTATDLADWLVRTLKMPFRKAHMSPARSWPPRSRRRPAGGIAAGRDAAHRAGHHQGGLWRAVGRALGGEPDQFWWHGVGHVRREVGEVAKEAGPEAALRIAPFLRHARRGMMA